MRQVTENLESKRLQYAMADQARAAGFKQVEVIDCDLGMSASIGSADRKGFDYLVSDVALEQVGAVVSRNVDRLSRTDKDWCHLLEVCQIFNTLILDEDRVYDLNDIDDQLVLGIKGTLSVVELKVLQVRMQRGREEKARRGELRQRLPPGFAYNADDEVVHDPDQRVREAIHLIFRKFRELWSARQVFMWLQGNKIEMPVNSCVGGKTKLIWKLPTISFVQSILGNPFYAGVYVYGRRSIKTTFEDGKLVKRAGRPCEPEESRVFLRDHHEGYIGWDEFERNRRRLRSNCMRYESDRSTAVVRSGYGLLSGILRCGHCGRKLHTRYWGKRGASPRYHCKGDYDAGGNSCVAFGGKQVDERFSKEILKVVSPLGIEASQRAIQQFRKLQEDRLCTFELEIQQLDYEVQRAFEQYDLVDPRNRLVAADLERRWNVKLEARDRARKAITAFKVENKPLTADSEAKLRNLGAEFEQVWESPLCPPELKKKIIHTLIEEITVKLNGETSILHFVVNWKGGCHTKIELPKPRRINEKKTSSDALDIIRKMAPRYGDGEIASVLNRSGLRTGKDLRWNQTRVKTARRNYSIPGHTKTKPNPDILSLAQAAKHCEVSPYTIKQLVVCGLLENNQTVPYAPWEILKANLDSQHIQRTLERMKRTGKLVPEGGNLGSQIDLPLENKEGDNDGYYK
jgi:DNA invertase Pin-like site-specific DNA recombinase